MAGTNQDDLRSAPWWPELLRLKDTLSWAALAEKFGVGAHALRRSLAEAGETKASIPPGRKPQGTKAAAPAAAPVNPLAGLAGKKSDPEVAREARVSIAEVKAYRKANGIAPFLKGPPPVAPVAAAPVAPAPAAPEKGSVVRRRTKGGTVEETRTAAPAPVAAKVAEKPAAKAAAKPAAKSGLDAFKDQMGQVQDDVIAQAAGVHRLEVGAYRRKLGIPAYNGHRFRKGEAPVAPKPVKAEAPTQRPSAIDPYASLLGTVPDSEIATLAGVTVEAVKKFRQRRDIARFVPKGEAVKPAEVKPAEAKPAAVKPAAVKPAEVKPAEVKPAEVAPNAPKRRGRPPGRKNGEGKAALAKKAAAEAAAQVKPAEVKPVDVKPAAVKAAEVKPVDGKIGDRPPRKSALLPFVHLIGVLTDREVAEKADVTVENVRMWRTRRGIPSVTQRAAAKAPEAPVVKAAPVVVAPPAPVVVAKPAPVVEAAPAPVVEAAPVAEAKAPVAKAPKAVKAAEPAPKAAPAPTAVDSTEARHAFQVSVYSGDRKRDFALIAADVVDAARSATEALSRRDDGPWRIQVIRELAESLE